MLGHRQEGPLFLRQGQSLLRSVIPDRRVQLVWDQIVYVCVGCQLFARDYALDIRKTDRM
jgi:hypothetical protein